MMLANNRLAVMLITKKYHAAAAAGIVLFTGCLPEPEEPVVVGSYSLSGQISYQYVPYASSGDGLNYDATEIRPIRGVTVKLIGDDTDDEIAETVSGEDGSYSFDYEGANRVRLWIYSESDTPRITIEDNTSNDEVYVFETENVDASTSPTFDVVATSGWNGSSYRDARLSAPFAILDAAYTAAKRFASETTPAPSFSPLKINWSTDNRPEGGDKEDGDIGTSHWDGEELYILGAEDVDTDEFDSHVIVHEWGHYFESTVSRSDSIGGPHSSGDVLDPRVAFGEGWGNALSAIILDPDSVYTDSMGNEQSSGFGFDLEDNFKSTNDRPGWYSEETIQAILYDLYDAANEAHDTVALGLQPIYSTMVGGQKTTESLTTIFSFITVLKTGSADAASNIDSLVAYHTADATYGVSTISDIWGTGESHNGGVSGSLPLYTTSDVEDSVSVKLIGGEEYNKLTQNRYLRFTGTGSKMTIESTCNNDVDLYVYRSGSIVGAAYTYSGNESLQFSSSQGATYILNVQGWAETNGSYSATIDIQ